MGGANACVILGYSFFFSFFCPLFKSIFTYYLSVMCENMRMCCVLFEINVAVSVCMYILIYDAIVHICLLYSSSSMIVNFMHTAYLRTNGPLLSFFFNDKGFL